MKSDLFSLSRTQIYTNDHLFVDVADAHSELVAPTEFPAPKPPVICIQQDRFHSS